MNRQWRLIYSKKNTFFFFTKKHHIKCSNKSIHPSKRFWACILLFQVKPSYGPRTKACSLIPGSVSCSNKLTSECAPCVTKRSHTNSTFMSSIFRLKTAPMLDFPLLFKSSFSGPMADKYKVRYRASPRHFSLFPFLSLRGLFVHFNSKQKLKIDVNSWFSYLFFPA